MSRILIIGESCMDLFFYCDALRLAPDIPVPVLNIKHKNENAGMAMNVYLNIKNHIDNVNIETNNNWKSCVKSRYVHDMTNHMFFRVDSNDKVDRIILNEISYDYDLIVISDYNKGYLEVQDIEEICNNHSNVFIDTKKNLGSWAEKAAFIKINDFEYNKSLPYINEILKNKIIHTLGAEGCEYQGIRYGVDKVEVKDSSGAGDSFMSALVVKYSETQDIVESIKFANLCASEVVKHRGVTTI